MICHFCQGPGLATDEPVNPDLMCDGALRCCASCLTSARVVCCVLCEYMVRREDARERPDLGESPMGGHWLCNACAPTEPVEDDVPPCPP
jgi:hypothetical protein